MPLNRYEDVNGQQPIIVTPNSTLSRSGVGSASGVGGINNYKMMARALYNFQSQNHRELGFKKGDLIYVKRQIDANWYEGERNAMVGIFPTTYVEIVSENDVSSIR